MLEPLTDAERAAIVKAMGSLRSVFILHQVSSTKHVR
jgi:hypothetical protein